MQYYRISPANLQVLTLDCVGYVAVNLAALVQRALQVAALNGDMFMNENKRSICHFETWAG